MENANIAEEGSLTPLLNSHLPLNFVGNHEIALPLEVSSNNSKLDVPDYLTTETLKKYRLDSLSHAMDLDPDL